MSEGEDDHAPAVAAQGTVLEWVAWPLRDRPLAGVLAGSVVLTASILAGMLGQHLLFGALAGAILVGSLNPFFSPTTFRLDDEGVQAVRGPVRKVRRWKDVRACFVDRYGATLSPFIGRAWLEPYRGVRLLFADNRDEVVRFVRERLGGEVRVVEVSSDAGRA